jgi:hypothetical protein
MTQKEVIQVHGIWFGSFCEGGAVGGVSLDRTILLKKS